MYKNIIDEGDIFRKSYKDGIDKYIERLEKEGNEKSNVIKIEFIITKIGSIFLFFCISLLS